MCKTTNKYALEVRERAIRTVLGHERDHTSRWAAVVRRDAALRIEVRRVFEANFRINGVRKV